ncbi:MAG: hypothetical protein LBR12_03265 [Opitutaceae bacterium]|jgi:hypothetical protein|nr:hypothetical protein [Opitutaceae bacterium]
MRAARAILFLLPPALCLFQPRAEGAARSKAPGSLPDPIVLPEATPLRAARSSNARLISTLQPGTQIRVDFPDEGWSAAFRAQETRRDEFFAVGYIPTPPPPQAAAPAAAGTDSAAKPPPAAQPAPAEPPNPDGVSVQCSAITKKGTRCSRNTTHTSGLCTQHNKSAGGG